MIKPESHVAGSEPQSRRREPIDHWRHYFLILGVLWGPMAATTLARPSARPAALARPSARA